MNTATKFPEEIDDRVYFQDLDISHIEDSELYTKYYNSGDYDSAVDVLQSSGMFYYGADILNLFENRILAIEEYLISQIGSVQLTAYQNYAPTITSSMDVGFTWISDI